MLCRPRIHRFAASRGFSSLGRAAVESDGRRYALVAASLASPRRPLVPFPSGVRRREKWWRPHPPETPLLRPRPRTASAGHIEGRRRARHRPGAMYVPCGRAMCKNTPGLRHRRATTFSAAAEDLVTNQRRQSREGHLRVEERDGGGGGYREGSTFGSFLIEKLQEPELTVSGKSQYAELSRRVHRFWGLHDRVRSMVLAALEKFNRTNESKYCLHVICGVNELVSGPKFSSPMGRVLPSFPFKYQYSHINFLATRLNKKVDAQPTKLFFAECNLDDVDDAWCIPPVGGQARCFYCETQGNRIIHPALPVFHGFDFEEALRPDNKKFYDNDQIIFLKATCVDWVDGVEEAAIYNSYRLRDDNGNGDSKRLRL